MVDSNTFVRVCRKFKFFTLELGPSIKRQDNSAAEVFELLTTEVKPPSPPPPPRPRTSRAAPTLLGAISGHVRVLYMMTRTMLTV
eukprot:451693-Rhodomonas_salina.1